MSDNPTVERLLEYLKTPEAEADMKKIARRHMDLSMDRIDGKADWVGTVILFGIPMLVSGALGYALCLWAHA